MAMNYLEKKRQEEQTKPAGLQGVSEKTRAQQARYEGGYTPSQQTTTAQQNLAAVQQNRPQTYNSKYGAALDGILAKIQGGQDFNYSFDGDEMFKYYADLYTQNAKQGAANAMGQAVGLTGGYGNSWASAQANQAYQQALLPLYERGLDLRDRAYQMHQDKENKLMNQAGMLMDMDSADYGRYRDTMQDYYADVDRAQAAADNAQAFDYKQYGDMLDYWNGKAASENADFRAGQDVEYRDRAFDESVRQANLDEQYRQQTFQQSVEEFNRTNELDWAQLEEKQREYDASLSEDQRQYNQKIAIAYVTDILANGQMPSNDLLVAAGLSLEDAQKLMAQIQAGGGPAPKPKKDPKELPELFRKNMAEADYITPEDRAASVEYGKLDQGPQYAPQTSNLDTPVHFTQQVDQGPGIAPKTATVTMNPLQYNAMLRKMFEEDMKKSNR